MSVTVYEFSPVISSNCLSQSLKSLSLSLEGHCIHAPLLHRGERDFIGQHISVCQIRQGREQKSSQISLMKMREVQIFSGEQQTNSRKTKQIICPDGRLQELCYWEKNKHKIIVLKNKKYPDISLLSLVTGTECGKE